MASDIYNTGASKVGNAASQGQSAINSFDPNQISNDTASGFSNLFNTQQGQQNNYLQDYKNTIAGNPSVTSLYGQANDQFNVPTLQQNATQLNNAVLQTPNNVLNAAKGFNFDNNQVQNQTNMMLSRLSPQATAAQNAANTASGLAKGYVDAGIQQNQFNLLPVQEQGQMLGDLWARQATGYTTASQQKFEGLLQKMQSGVQLSQSEMQEYSKLAAAESQYQATLSTNEANKEVARIGQQNVTLDPGQTYYNPYGEPGKNVYNPLLKVRGQ